MVTALVFPATCEAEAGGSLEPRSSKLQWAMTAPLHSSLGDRARSYLFEKKKQVGREKIGIVLWSNIHSSVKNIN